MVVADNYFTGSKDNIKHWIGHPRFELIRHGTIGCLGNLLFFNVFFALSCKKKKIYLIFTDVTETLLLEVDRIYHLACPASPIFYKYNPVKASCLITALHFLKHYISLH